MIKQMMEHYAECKNLLLFASHPEDKGCTDALVKEFEEVEMKQTDEKAKEFLAKVRNIGIEYHNQQRA